MRTWEAELRQGEQVHAVGDAHILGVLALRGVALEGVALRGLRLGPLSLLPEGAPPGLTQRHTVHAGRLTVLLSDKRRHEDRQDLRIQRRQALDFLFLGDLKQVEIRVTAAVPALLCLTLLL